MTANKAIKIADTLRPNQIPADMKVEWVKQLEWTIFKEVYNTHDATGIDFTDMESETFADDTLFAEAPYDEVYTDYLLSKIDYYNAEYERYNNDTATFKALYESFAADYNRSHMSLSATLKY